MKENAEKLFPINGDTPLLLYGHKRTQTLFSISPHNPKASLKRIPQLRHKEILGFSYGWFMLRDWNQHSMYSLFNPVTMKVINLPPLLAAPEPLNAMFCALKSSPDCDDCLFFLSFNGHGIMFLCSPGKPNCTWLTQPLKVNGEDIGIADAFTLNGVFYVLVPGQSSRIASLYEVDVAVSNSVIFRPWLEVPIPCSDFIEKRCLVESCGHAYFVCMFFVQPIADLKLEPRAIKVFQLDESGPICREINSLNGRSFFIGWTSRDWCWGTTNDPESGGGIQSNCIYFLLPSLAPDRDSLLSVYSYNLNNQSITPLCSCPDLLRPKLFPVWLIPPQQRLLSREERIKKVDHPHRQEVLHHDVGQQVKFNELPLHLIECISKYMHLFEYWNFRASCKTFRSVCPAPRWRTNNVPPLFMFFKNSNNGSGLCELIDPVRCDSRFSILPLSPDPFTLKFSNNGWLLTFVDQKYLEFYNLFTGARGRMSHFSRYASTFADFKSIGFSTYPPNPDCLTVAISASGGGNVTIYLFKSKRRLWGSCWFNNGGQFSISNSNPVFLGDAIYFLDRQGYLGVYQGVNGKAASRTWNVYDKPQTVEHFDLGSLLECEGQLYSVFVEKVGKWVQVFRFDESVMSWVEIKCLENHCFFISRASSFSLFTRDPPMRNKIYLPRFRGNKMIYYSLDTRKFHVSGSEEVLVNLYGTSEPFTCCWI